MTTETKTAHAPVSNETLNAYSDNSVANRRRLIKALLQRQKFLDPAVRPVRDKKVSVCINTNLSGIAKRSFFPAQAEEPPDRSVLTDHHDSSTILVTDEKEAFIIHHNIRGKFYIVFQLFGDW